MTTIQKTAKAGLTTLDELATQINDEHRLAEDAARSAVDHALRAGELLIEAKGRMKHGEWLPWLEQHCEASPRTVQRYIQVARNRGLIEQGIASLDDGANASCVSHLSMTGALRLIQQGAKKVAHEKAERLFSGPPPSLEPDDEPTVGSANTNGRKKRLLWHKGESKWCVEIGPNEVGRNLDRYIEEMFQRDEFQRRLEEVTQVQLAAEEEMAEAEQALEDANLSIKHAKSMADRLGRDVRAQVESERGEAHTHVESSEYMVTDPGLHTHLQTLTETEIIEFLESGAGGDKVELGNRGYWGDIRKLKWSQMRPAGPNGWTQVGMDGWGVELGDDSLWC